jgi:hypothetical protein
VPKKAAYSEIVDAQVGEKIAFDVARATVEERKEKHTMNKTNLVSC